MWLLALLGVILLGAIGFFGFQLLGEPVAVAEPNGRGRRCPECENVALTTLRSQARDMG